MTGPKSKPRRLVSSDLERVLEPLIGYICATEQPKAALSRAFAVLFQEVSRVQRVAAAHVASRTTPPFNLDSTCATRT